jgi:hypothetical protein
MNSGQNKISEQALRGTNRCCAQAQLKLYRNSPLHRVLPQVLIDSKELKATEKTHTIPSNSLIFFALLQCFLKLPASSSLLLQLRSATLAHGQENFSSSIFVLARLDV